MIEAVVRRFLYWPTRVPDDLPPPPYVAGAREVWIDTPGGGRVHGLYWPAPQGRPTIAFFHGNAQTVFEWALITEELAPLECGLLLIDYPGYGKSRGEPSERTNYDAARGALRWLADNEVPPARTLLMGKSLGGGVVTEVAGDAAYLGMVLESTFTSIPAVVSRLIPMIPMGALMREELYESERKIATLTLPTLIVHGTRDEIIPFAEGEKLYAQAAGPKEFFRVEDATHNDVSIVAGDVYGRTIRAWLDGVTGAR